MLNRGFALLDKNIPVVANSAPTATSYVHSEPAPVTSPIVQKYASDAPKIQYATGGVGVQFGAFSSMDSANSMVARVKNILGANAHVEPTGTGLYRVRVTGLSESAAQGLKNRGISAGIDCYVFH
jgi:cell division protein FtsN